MFCECDLTSNTFPELCLSGAEIIRFTNCYILRNESLIKDDLWIQNGIILNGLCMFFTKKLLANVIINTHGAVISPGFIDIQINGAFGFDFSDPDSNTVENCRSVARSLPQTGVTGFCPTIITSSDSTYHKILTRFKQYENIPGHAQMLGLHLEGPFISKLSAGMHSKEYIREFGPDPAQTLSDTYGPYENITRIITVAPELDGCLEAISELTDQGMVVSLGHTNADCSTLQHAVSAGARLVTHLFNAMPVFHHRSSHLFGAITTATSDLYVGLIADRMHVHPAAMRVAEAIAPGRVVLVTDANTATGLADGAYTFGGQAIEVTDGLAYLSGTNCLAGSTASLPICVRNFWLDVCQHTVRHSSDQSRELWCGLGKALAAASAHPARVLRLYQNTSGQPLVRSLKKGSLEPGADADLVILCPTSLSHPKTPSLNILSTWINGKPVHHSMDAKFTVVLRTD